MRRLWICVIAVALVVSSAGFAAARQAATKPVPKKPAAKVQLPAAVTDAFKKAYPDAVIKNTGKEVENGKTVYEVESVDKGMNRDLIYSPDGTVVELEEQINPADLPAPVTAALKQLYPKATVTKAEKLMKDGAVQYEMALKGAAKSTAAFTPDGKLIPTVPEKK
jgi:hypothetical protein